MAEKKEKYELIIAEKPSVSKKLAEAISTSTPVQKKTGKVAYYECYRDDQKIVVAPAAGHVFTLTQDKGQRGYPVFKIHWVPSFEVAKSSAFTQDYVKNIKKLAKNADKFVSACDYDIEGEVIGFNVLKHLCGKTSTDTSRRMKFSSLTKDTLIKSYENAEPHLNFGMANAGITRHMLDWYYGINVSRALSKAYKTVSGYYAPMSAGRVQTPTLKILTDREKEISAFVPEPFWVLSILLENGINAVHKEERFFKKDEADAAHEAAKGNDAEVSQIDKTRRETKVPTPFNLGDLQSEAYKVFRFTPKRTQMVAQGLYEKTAISYPRTSSQKLPDLDIKELLQKIGEQKAYTELTDKLLKTELKPNEGKKTDPAHPCIYPTGEKPKALTEDQKKLYDLIVKRFFSIFGTPAVREMQTVTFSVNGESFIAKGALTIEENWFEYYRPYVKLKEEELPEMKEGDKFKVNSLDEKEDQTKPPGRYSQASIVKKMEQIGIGTKATRAGILDTLYSRHYIEGEQIQVTDFGKKVVETLANYVPELTSEELTRKFDTEVQQIREGKLENDIVLKEAQETLTTALEKFDTNMDKIGAALAEGQAAAFKQRIEIGPCNLCGEQLLIRRSRASKKQFVGCSGYPKCTNSFPLPQGAAIHKTEKTCEHDGLPIIEVRRQGKRKFEMCIDHNCKSKADWGKDKGKKSKKGKEKKEEKPEEKPEEPTSS